MTTLRKLCKDTTEVTHKMTSDLDLDDHCLRVSWGDKKVWIDRPPNLGRAHHEVLAAFLGLSRVPGDPELVAGEGGPGYLITPGGGASVSHHVAPEDVLGVITAIDGLASVEPKALAGQLVEESPLLAEYQVFANPNADPALTVDVSPCPNKAVRLKTSTGYGGTATSLPPGTALKVAYQLFAILKTQGHSLNEADYDDKGQPISAKPA